LRVHTVPWGDTGMIGDTGTYRRMDGGTDNCDGCSFYVTGTGTC
jgi:hypothetical protein